MPWTDSHCHLQLGDSTVADARAGGVERLVCIGTDAEQSAAAVAIAAAYDDVWATVGLHPHDAKNGVDTIVNVLDSPKVVAVGECGLDYHYDHSPRDVQRDAFAAQLSLARKRSLPVVIHTREAWNDTFAILSSGDVPDRIVFHCFTGGPDEARRALDAGAWLSFSGIVTFNNAGDVRAAAELCPLDRLLVETDAPFLAPVPHRGQPNRPALLPFVGAGVAAAKGLGVAEIEAASWENASRVFDLS